MKTICYGKEELWEDREDALRFYLRCLAASEGAERERYLNVYTKLMMGLEVCSDDGDD